MHEIIELEEKSEKICGIKEKLIGKIDEELSKSTKDIDTQELGEVVDMVKDLADVEEKCWKGLYYKEIVTAMKEAKIMESQDSYGYNRNRYASGRYAPSGHGNSTMGYMPPMMEEDMYYPYMMGYSGSNSSNSDSSRSGGNNGQGSSNRGGYSSGNGNMNGYYPSGAGNRSQSGNRMGYDGENLMESFEAMYAQADPEQKRRMKEELHKISEKM